MNSLQPEAACLDDDSHGAKAAAREEPPFAVLGCCGGGVGAQKGLHTESLPVIFMTAQVPRLLKALSLNAASGRLLLVDPVFQSLKTPFKVRV